MRPAHQRSEQSWLAACALGAAAPHVFGCGIVVLGLALLFGASACTTESLADSIWPPSDFEILVEEVHMEGSEPRVVRRFRASADGVVAYGTSSISVVDQETRTLLPVFDRLSVYRLVPTSIRALARRLDRCGVGEMDRIQGERGAEDGVSIALAWQAFGKRRLVTARGRVHGAMAECMAVVAAHLPPGEGFGLPGLAERVVVPVLRGVPRPEADAAGALQAHQELLGKHRENQGWLLDAFALACHLAQRESAEVLLRRWTDVMAAQHPPSTFLEDEPRLMPAVLQRMLPARP